MPNVVPAQSTPQLDLRMSIPDLQTAQQQTEYQATKTFTESQSDSEEETEASPTKANKKRKCFFYAGSFFFEDDDNPPDNQLDIWNALQMW